MLEDLVDWAEIVYILAKKTGRSKADICRDAGIAGSVMSGMTSPARRLEPKHSEGEQLIKQFKDATHGDKPPMRKRNRKNYCSSCQRTKDISDLFRVSENASKCLKCIREIRKNTNMKNWK